MGFGLGGFGTGGEIATLQHAYEHARFLALSRMQQEAAMLGANLVLVTFKGRGFEWSSDLVEFNAAVRVEGKQPSPEPVLTLLEPVEFWKLHHAGYWPTDSHVLEFLAVGTSVLAIETHEQPPAPQLVLTVNE